MAEGSNISPLHKEAMEFTDVPLSDPVQKTNLQWSISKRSKLIGGVTLGVMLVVGIAVGVVASVSRSESSNDELLSNQHSQSIISPNYEFITLEKNAEHDGPSIQHTSSKGHNSQKGSEKEKSETANKNYDIIELQKSIEHDRGSNNKIEITQKERNIETQSNSIKQTTVLNQDIYEENSQIFDTVKIENENLNPVDHLKSEEKNTKSNICETPECAIAASNLVESLDITVDPCDDFFSFACGGWIDKHPIPESGSTGTFNEAGDLMQKRLKLLLSTPASGSDPEPLHLIRRHYSGCIDQDTIDSVGTSVLINSLSQMGGYPLADPDWDEANFDLEDALINLISINRYPILGVGIDADIYNTTRKILYAGQGEVGPLGSFIMSNLNIFSEYKKSYKKFLVDSAKILLQDSGLEMSDQDIDQQAEDLIAFESSISTIMQTNLTDEEIYDLTDVEGLQGYTDEMTPGQISWLEYFKLMFTGTDVIILDSEPVYATAKDYLKDLSSLLDQTNKRTIANFIGWFWVHTMAGQTSYALGNVSFTFEQEIYGSDAPYPRDDFCAYETSIDLSHPTSRVYVDEFFPAAAKTENQQMVEDMRSSFEIIFDENTWMLPEDLQVAKEKLEAVESFVAYPDWIINDQDLSVAYEGLVINENEQFMNLVRIGDFLNFWTFTLFRDEPVSTFVMPPTIVNAFYNPLANSITILAGILQPPFYAHNTLAALNYGGIGMVIGHEFTHGFDNSGRMFDKDGNLVEWWSEDTINAFNERAQCFVDQYDVFHPPELVAIGDNDTTVNGIQTLGENIADNGGIREAFRAYQIYVERNGEEPRLPGLDEFTPNHLFYLGFASLWCEAKTAEVMMNQILGDPHSPGRYRILGPLANDANFAETWNCPAGSPMNRGDERCLLW